MIFATPILICSAWQLGYGRGLPQALSLTAPSQGPCMSLSLLSRYAFFAACVLFTLASLPFSTMNGCGRSP
jgi:hypothetical protein